ncbi:hypothetical protein LJC61_07375 [Ruminococcaceae bacterium OttesenSCG-928-A16]|nr:hypothetical protein [Ruminococcaceae bacterium OttesenSCG-928-A16]
MALNSVTFLLFLGVVCVVAYALPRKIRYIWLLVCSYAFYLYTPTGTLANLPALALLVGTTLFSYACALGIGKCTKPFLRRLFLGLSLLSCLGILFGFKYTNFFIDGINSLTGAFGTASPISHVNLLMPLGISYYILQAVGYTVDVYTGTLAPEANPIRYALFVGFFPGIVTGPINRAGSMLPQYKNPPAFDYNRVAGGLFRVLWGIFKKMVIADTIGQYTAAVFATPAHYAGPQLLLAALLFAYQLYADFGGTCDIAIGAAQMLGFTFAENFNRPFAAKTFAGLWQRWHISLTSFFRETVFTPLVWSRWTEKIPFIGKKFTKPPTASSVFIIFALSGLWHGPHVNYVVWGLLNGALMVFSSTKLNKKRDKLAAKIPLYRARHLRGFCQRVLVYLLFAGCLVFFAAALYQFPVSSWAAGLLNGWDTLFTSFAALNTVLGLDFTTMLLLAGCIVLVEAVEKCGNVAGWIRRRGWFIRWPLYILLLAMLLVFGKLGQSPAIYQQY